jgi:hypothetical protein
LLKASVDKKCGTNNYLRCHTENAVPGGGMVLTSSEFLNVFSCFPDGFNSGTSFFFLRWTLQMLCLSSLQAHTHYVSRMNTVSPHYLLTKHAKSLGFKQIMTNTESQDGSVGTATAYGLHCQCVNPGRGKIFLFSTTSRLAKPQRVPRVPL